MLKSVIPLLLFDRILLDRDISKYPALLAYCLDLYGKNIRSPYMLAFMVDFYEDQLEVETSDNKQETLQKAIDVSISVLIVQFLPSLIVE